VAGNAAVAHHMAGGRQIQRHKGIEPAIVNAYVLTDAEKDEIPTMEETKDLLSERTAILEEWSPLNVKAKRSARAKQPEDPDDAKRRIELEARQREIGRLLRIRRLADIDKTLEGNGQTGGAAAWFANVHTTTFLGKTVQVHDTLAARLDKAEKELAPLPVPPGGWIAHTVSTLRDPNQGLHTYGLAIDIDPGQNPFLLNPDDAHSTDYEPRGRSRSIKEIIDRAVLLVLALVPDKEKFFAKPDVTDRDERVDATYDKLQTASDALERYFTLDSVDNRTELQALVDALGDKDPKKRTADDWAKAITADRKILRVVAGDKSWADPTHGFLHMDKRLVKAMTNSAGARLTWLGDETIASGRDIMHFDTRAVGPIKRIWSTENNRWTYLGGG
jgi:hypothetical protein